MTGELQRWRTLIEAIGPHQQRAYEPGSWIETSEKAGRIEDVTPDPSSGNPRYTVLWDDGTREQNVNHQRLSVARPDPEIDAPAMVPQPDLEVGPAPPHPRPAQHGAMYDRVGDALRGRRVVTAEPHMTVIDAARRMTQHRISALPIVDEGHLVGIITERDITQRVVAKGRDGRTLKVRNVMTANPITLSPEAPFTEALTLFHTAGCRHLPVLDGGKLVGVISIRDLLRA